MSFYDPLNPRFDGKRAVIVHADGRIPAEWMARFVRHLDIRSLHVIGIAERPYMPANANYKILLGEVTNNPLSYEQYPDVEPLHSLIMNAVAVVSSDINFVGIAFSIGLKLHYLAVESMNPRRLAIDVNRAVRDRYPVSFGQSIANWGHATLMEGMIKGHFNHRTARLRYPC